ncbi:MAG: hypothetical protein A3K03_03930 [Bdellovibrionales bacterium RIFOXYD1_FULL_44_7]|nr:MAG: hypothetical protein A3K03_03930 [Bdellovibrionales bacterium RIFOXYD1_FULL_44_7]
MEGLQHQSATLKKLNAPGDNPVGAAKVLEVRTDKVNNDQFLMNAKLAATFLENSDHAVGELSDIVARAKEIALGQSSGASSNQDTRLGIAEEVTQLFQQAVATGNRRVGDRYLFGGYKVNRPPVDQDGKYIGDDGQMMVEVTKDVFISMNVPGDEIFNTNPEGLKQGSSMGGYEMATRGPAAEDSETAAQTMQPENTNIFDELQNLRIGLLTGDLDGIRSCLERFDDMHAKLIAQRAKIGSRLRGLETTNNALERTNITNATLTSSIEDADMAQVVSELAKEETVFRSALQSAQKLVQPTLMDFLR